MKRADVVSFAVKYYSCFTEEGSKKHNLIPNFWKLLSGNLYPLGVSKIVGPDFSVPKMYPGHIVTAYGDKVLMYSFSSSCRLVSTGRKFRCMGREGFTVCSKWSPSEQTRDHNRGEDREGEGQRGDRLWNPWYPTHCPLPTRADM